MDCLLTDIEARILACLIEKQVTTPDSYPLTLNSLVLACNQKSNRDPVVEYDDVTVVRGLDGLRDKKLAMMVGMDGARVPKYEHNCQYTLPMPAAELALLGVLMLRGPQTAGELKTRTERYHPFASVEEVETTLSRMAEQPTPLIVKLPRQPGKREGRFAHLLCGEPVVPDTPGAQPQPEAARLELEANNSRMELMADQITQLQEKIATMQEQLTEQQAIIEKLRELL
ncbi:MAG: YceH family protein [Lentisphaeria bacterium]|nr:YceH family protein [Lentisphaeria bacterium]